ncbi:magnesium/cobalt transporter CorA [Blochmannia endosymbiont of Camponotus sp.]|uniref:magnesium/cobalt transporter CorA n=1 Tax=Blochmannia endosymbiont of Camponotus sp. TaxID=700220 RepID=UPI00202459AA|nr:magnesium/cobalt transporter CorA [Blochmannia endosymbiont of Camponotus sp.]URJ23886.1 magnesium/cobalt transporter CorA [Blochmannia endosymbiont of Camponotus sp.]
MYNIFQLKNNHLFRINEKEKIPFLNNIIWIDIINSHDDGHNYIPNILLHQKIKFFELQDIKKTTRFFKDKNGLHIHSFFFSYNSQEQIDNSSVFFTIHNGCLYTSRKKEFPVFCMYQKYLHNHLLINGNVYELLLNLFEVKLDELANKIEHIYSTLETLSSVIMNGQQIDEYDHALSDLAILENIGWKIRVNLLDTERAIKFLIRKVKLPVLQQQYANDILSEITLLLPHNEYVFHQISSLTQSAMGFINIEQNRIIKIFSVIFLPPTLIASSYGMNFKFMPELQWSFGYPSAIILMILSGLAPYIYFKYKNWL